MAHSDDSKTCYEILYAAIHRKEPVALALSGIASWKLFNMSFEDLVIKLKTEGIIKDC